MTEPILIVEDAYLQQQMLKTLLRRKLDYGVIVENNGRLALDILDTGKTNIIKFIMLTGSKDIDTMVNVIKRERLTLLQNLTNQSKLRQRLKTY